MKIIDSSLRVYENLGAALPKRTEPSFSHKPAGKPDGITGSQFAELLSRQELNFLAKNFQQSRLSESAAGKSEEKPKNRIDLLA